LGCRSLIDFCIVVDGSDSISRDDFSTLRKAISSLIDRLNIDKDEGRMGIVVYSSKIARKVPLTSDKWTLQKEAEKLPHPRDGTNTALGIETMKELFQASPRPGVPKVGIVVTDGISKNTTETVIQANLTKDLGINMFSVGVSQLIDMPELIGIASSERQVLTVDSFDALARNIEELVLLVCPTTPVPTTTMKPAPTPPPTQAPISVKCKSLIDFVMVFDGSDSISAPDFQLLRESVEKLVDQLNIGVGEGRMGIIVYSRLVNMTVNLTHNKLKLKEDARIMPHPRSGTNTALGIAAMLKMFKSSNRDVPKVGIVVTDGISLDPEETAKEARLSKDYGINMFSVGITKKIDHDELNKIASNENQVLMLDSFDELARNIGGLVKLVCPADCGQPPKLPYTIMDPGSTIEGTRRSYKCEANTIMEGNPDIVCSDDGGWSVTDLYCRPDCKEPLPVPNAVIRPGGTLEGAVRTYDCERTTVLEGDPNVFCGNNGQWSKHKFYCRPDCGQPDLVPRATYQVQSTLEGNVTRYKCNPDTVLEGEPIVICQSNGQWSPPDFYCRPNCGKPLNIPRASIPDGPTLEGSTLEYQCHKNTVMEGNPVIVCGQDGKWSDSNLYCRPDCKEPSIVQRATVMPGMTLEGASRQYVCEHGTILEGDPNVVCEGSGQWSKSNFYCRPDCGIPVAIPRASIAKGSTLEGNSIQYQCDHNTVMEGFPVITCGPDGQWSKNDLYSDCGLPIDVLNAAWLPGPSLEGNVTSYVCDITTVMEGNPQVICQRNGEWSKPEFYCRPDCGIPIDVPNAKWLPGPSLEGSVTSYKCIGNTMMEGDPTSSCGKDGKWSHPNFYCRPDCGIPINVPNAKWDVGSTLEGSTSTYSCIGTSVLEGDASITCGKDGRWTPPTFYSDCGKPPPIPRARSGNGPTLEGSLVTYMCDPKTVTEGNPSIICAGDGSWSSTDLYCRPDCGVPINVPRAVTPTGLTLEGSRLVYECQKKTVLEGNSSIICESNGQWTRPLFYCRPDCGIPPDVQNAIMDSGSTLEEASRYYTCKPGTVLEGNAEIRCGSSGQWSKPQFRCKYDCGAPVVIPYAHVDEGLTTEGAIRTYMCNNGTIMDGSSTVTCKEDGTWSPISFQCKHDCGEPYMIPNAIARPGPTVEGSVRQYQCEKGTTLEGNPEIRCKNNGKWTLTSIRCRPDCGPPPHVPRTTVSHGATVEGSVATYKCDSHTTMEGNSKIVCKKNGKWSKPSFQCRTDCGEPMSVPYAVLLPGPTTEGMSRYYECSSGCETIGNPEIRCMEDGKWTQIEFYCHGPCDFCKMQYGVGFNPHPEDCDKFTQCYFDQNGQVQAVFRQCPFGQYWDQDVLTCRPSEQVQCMHEKCHMPGLLTYPYGNKTSCKAFWKCNLGKSIGMCCPDGYAYDSHQGCVHDPDCKDTCPPLVYHEGACDTRPSWKNPYGYQQFIPGLGWKEMECGSGSKYDCTSCKCEYHESFLPGKDLVVRMRYLDVPDVGLRGLISNGEYDSPSMMIVKSKRNLHYMAKCESNRITSFYLPMSPGNWNDLTFMHDTKRLEGKVNNVRAEKWAFGHIQVLDSALQIGYAPGFQNFHGYVDYVSIYLCRPDD
ncbi:hypothetical protein FSP39_014448, partial [Pinctada imbricata]